MLKRRVFNLRIRLSEVFAHPSDPADCFKLYDRQQRKLGLQTMFWSVESHSQNCGGGTTTLTAWIAADRRDTFPQVQRPVTAMNHEY